MPKTTTLLDKVDSARRAMGEGDQSVQQLATQAGLSSTPLTAYGTGMIGGSSQQAKMAGVPAQKKAALAPMQVAAPRGETQLEQAQTLQTTTATAEEENKKKLAGQYAQSLGTFGAKVNEWVEAAKKKITGQTAQVQVDASDALLAGLDAGKKTQATDLLKQIATTTDPVARQQLELKLNNLLPADASGKPRTVDSVIGPEAKAKMYQDVAASIQSAVTAGQTAAIGEDRKITLSDFTNLGTTPQELATLLKVTPEEVGNYSLSQLQSKISEVSQREFGTTQQVKAGLASGVLSSADRAALRQYLRGIEQTGVAGAEAAVAGLADQIDKSQTVQFAGKAFTVDELLASPQLNDLFKTVMDEMKSPSGTGPNTEALKKEEPNTYNWLVQNRTAVQTLIDQSVATTKSFGETQAANKAALGTIADKQPGLAKDLGYDPNQLRAEKIDPSKLPGVFQAVGEITDPGQREVAAGILAQVSKVAGADAIKNLSADQVKALQPGVVGGPADVYLKTADAVKAAQNHTYIEDVIKDFSSGDESLDQLNANLSDDALASALGLPAGNTAELDTNQDGKIDQKDTDGIKKKISANLPSLDKLAAGERPSTNLNLFSLKQPVRNETQRNFFDSVKNAMSDGFMTQEEADALPFDLDTLKSLAANIPPAGAYIKNAIQGAIDRKQKAADEAAAAAEADRVRAQAAADQAASPRQRIKDFLESTSKKKERKWWQKV